MRTGRASAFAMAGLAVLWAWLVLRPAAAVHGDIQQSAKPQAITLSAERIAFDRDKPDKTRYGKLEWLGTLRLTSPSPQFGGYSGLALDKPGTRLLAISDTGRWLKADIIYRDGRMASLGKAMIGRLRGLDGKPLAGKIFTDSEAIAFAVDGTVTGKAFIAFERVHRIAEYYVTPEGIGAAIRHLKLPRRAKTLQQNKGIEALAILRGGRSKGALLAFSEEGLDAQGDHLGWLLGGASPGSVSLKRYGGFAITDMASLANGDVIILERRFRLSEGVKMRLRRVKVAELRPGALLDGEVLLQTDNLREIDNMEGLAIHRDARGRDILTLISDDNFNHTFQRTLLMQFALVE